MSLSDRRLLYVAMTRAKDDLHLLVPQRFFVHGQASKGDRPLYASRTRFITEALLPNFEKITWPAVSATRSSTSGQAAQRTSRRICGACGAKRPCRRHALLFAYEMLRNKSQKCSATDKLFGNSLSVVGTSAWRERRLSPIRCYGPNRPRLPRAAVVIEPVSDDSLRKTGIFPDTGGRRRNSCKEPSELQPRDSDTSAAPRLPSSLACQQIICRASP